MPYLLGASVLYGGTDAFYTSTWDGIDNTDAFYGDTGNMVDTVNTTTMYITGSRFQPLYPADPPIYICSSVVSDMTYCFVLPPLSHPLPICQGHEVGSRCGQAPGYRGGV